MVLVTRLSVASLVSIFDLSHDNKSKRDIFGFGLCSEPPNFGRACTTLRVVLTLTFFRMDYICLLHCRTDDPSFFTCSNSRVHCRTSDKAVTPSCTQQDDRVVQIASSCMERNDMSRTTWSQRKRNESERRTMSSDGTTIH